MKTMKKMLAFVLVFGMACGIVFGDGAPTFKQPGMSAGFKLYMMCSQGVQSSLSIKLTENSEEPDEFSAEGLPEGLVIDKSTGLVYGTTNCKEGWYEAKVIVKNSFGSDSVALCVRVTPKEGNTPYVVVANNGTPFVNPGDKISLEVSDSTYNQYIVGWRIAGYYKVSGKYPSVDENGYVTTKSCGFYLIVADLKANAPNRGSGFANAVEIVVGNPYKPSNEPVVEDPIEEEPITEEPISEEPEEEVVFTPTVDFEATKEITEDNQTVTVDLDISKDTARGASVIDILKGNVQVKAPKVYVFMEIGDTLFFAPTFSEEAVPYQNEATLGKYRVLDLPMNKFLRMALKGTKVKFTAGCIDDNMELVSNVAETEVEFK